MPARFESVSDVFPDQGATPYMVMDTTQSDPHWFPSIDALIAYVNRNESSSSCAAGMWIDISTGNINDRRQLLNNVSFGTKIPSSVMDTAIEPIEVDVVELHHGKTGSIGGDEFVFAVISCLAEEGELGSPHRGEFFKEFFETAADPAAMMSSIRIDEASNTKRLGGMSLCSLIASERLIVTMHAGSFGGLPECMQKMVHLKWPSAHFQCVNEAGKKVMNSNSTCKALSHTFRPTFTSTVMSALIAFTSENMLPDPTSLLNEVDSIDEMVLLIAPGERDQPDLLRRIAALRTRVAYLRKHIYTKEKLLQDCIAPPMRACFVSGYDARVMALYKETLSKVAIIVSRLDDTRDTLNQANLNFITASSMRMTQISADMDFKMKIFGQVATICMPLHFATAVYGMNCPVPFSKTEYTSLTAFWITLACMFVWMVVVSIPTFLDMYYSRQTKSLIPDEL